MLNTIPLIKTGGATMPENKPTIIEQMAHETDIEKGIRQIEEKNSLFVDDKTNIPVGTDIAKSFHKMENKIFGEGSIKSSKCDKTDAVKGFDLSDVTNKYSGQPIDLSEKNKNLLINFNENLNKFTIADENGQTIGYFTVDHIIKYLSDPFDIKKQVLNELDSDIYKRGKVLIKSLLFRLEYDKKNKNSRIIIIDYTKSGLMADIELLVKLNDILYKYMENDLNNVLSNVDKKQREKMEKNVKKFIYLLLNYTLKLISIVSEKIKDNKDKAELKKQLIKYSTSLVFRISTFVQDQLKIFNEQSKNLKEIMLYNIEIKDEIKEKLNKLLSSVQEQNILLKKDIIKPDPKSLSKYSEV